MLGAGQKTDESINHYVADAVNLRGVDAFANKIFIAVGRGSEQQVGELVGEQTINFFGHAAVAGAQAGFDVADADRELGTDESGGDGGVDVTIDEDEIGPEFEQDWFERNHHRRGLLRMRAGANAKVAIGLRHFQLLKKYIGHGGIVVLAGVDQSLADAGVRGQSAQHGGGFHEIGTGTNDVEDVHAVSVQRELYRVLFNGNAVLTGLGGNERSILFRQGHHVRRMCEGAVEGIGKGGGKSRGKQIDVDLQVPVRIDTVNGKGAAATVGRTQEIESNGPDRGATQRLRYSGLVPME
jgi:hypothetical protein